MSHPAGISPSLHMPGRITPDELHRAVSERRRLLYLENLIPLLRQKQRELRQDIYGSIRITQNWAFQSGKAWKADPTAAVAARAADLETQEEYSQTEQRLRALTQEREQLLRRQHFFDCCLNALPEEQRFLIEAKIVEGKTWNDIEALYENRYGSHLHRDTLRRRLSEGIRTLRDISS